MNLAADLLDQARMLAAREPKNPKQASLRRAVSASYYALFHLLAEDAARLFAEVCGRADAGTVSLLVRTFSHLDMKKASEAFGKSELPNALRSTREKYQTPDDLKLVVDAFASLYQARQDADYNTAWQISRPQTEVLVRNARRAFEAWERIKKTVDARTYLMCFSLWDTWNKKR